MHRNQFCWIRADMRSPGPYDALGAVPIVALLGAVPAWADVTFNFNSVVGAVTRNRPHVLARTGRSIERTGSPGL